MLPKPYLLMDIEARIPSENLIFFFEGLKKKKDFCLSEFKVHICFLDSVGLVKNPVQIEIISS